MALLKLLCMSWFLLYYSCNVKCDVGWSVNWDDIFAQVSAGLLQTQSTQDGADVGREGDTEFTPLTSCWCGVSTADLPQGSYCDHVLHRWKWPVKRSCCLFKIFITTTYRNNTWFVAGLIACSKTVFKGKQHCIVSFLIKMQIIIMQRFDWILDFIKNKYSLFKTVTCGWLFGENIS